MFNGWNSKSRSLDSAHVQGTRYNYGIPRNTPEQPSPPITLAPHENTQPPSHSAPTLHSNSPAAAKKLDFADNASAAARARRAPAGTAVHTSAGLPPTRI